MHCPEGVLLSAGLCACIVTPDGLCCCAAGGLGRAERGQEAAFTVCAGPEALECEASERPAFRQQCWPTRMDA